ncbi:MAG: hypothetical protein RBT32_03245 [Methanothermobacter sp.]|jgi:hypothetical protein|nr:hypothetical protein [Methanothermobacter sp.]HOQ19741.1 hypothetical protein [Methanothermobacter sp.]
MDEKGYLFTPMTILLFIPIVIMAIAYADIVNEANMLAALATGGDVTLTVFSSFYSGIEKATSDAGRNAAYNATRMVIDNEVAGDPNPFFEAGQSKEYIKSHVVDTLNSYIIRSARSLENETGREIYINNVPIDNYTSAVLTSNDVSITQEDPFGFYVVIKGGIPVKVVQEGQSFNGKTPEIRAYVSIEGLEDPYIWINTKHRQSNVIYKYPYYATNGTYFDYRLNESVDDNGHLQHLWYCLNGTDNPSSITPRPYYIVDSSGLSFFDRLENRSSGTNPKAGMSTFIIGNPLIEDHNGNQYISKIDREYFAGINGGTIKVKGHEMVDPFGSIFCLSQYYKELLGLAQNNYS